MINTNPLKHLKNMQVFKLWTFLALNNNPYCDNVRFSKYTLSLKVYSKEVRAFIMGACRTYACIDARVEMWQVYKGERPHVQSFPSSSIEIISSFGPQKAVLLIALILRRYELLRTSAFNYCSKTP
jgi:hypothetical protein